MVEVGGGMFSTVIDEKGTRRRGRRGRVILWKSGDACSSFLVLFFSTDFFLNFTCLETMAMATGRLQVESNAVCCC